MFKTDKMNKIIAMKTSKNTQRMQTSTKKVFSPHIVTYAHSVVL